LRQTLQFVAQALRVPLEQILNQPSSERMVIELVLDRPFHSFTDEDEERFLLALRSRLPFSGAVEVVGRKPGSVLLTLRVAAEDGGGLVGAVWERRLAELDVVAARRVRSGEAEKPAPKSPLPGPAGKPVRCSVLVVDDEPTLLNLLKEQLSGEFEVV